MDILHLSDLHFGTQKDAERWASQLAADLQNELGCRRLEALVISGDVGTCSVAEEYEAAAKFIASIRDEFGLDGGRIVVVPGNHDLNWELARKKGYDLVDRDEVDGKVGEECLIPVGDDAVRVRNPEGYPQRFANFAGFYQQVTGRPYPLGCEEQAVIRHLPALNLLFMELNSCWELDHHFKARASVNSGAIARALDALRTNPVFSGCRKVAVFHHPLQSPDPDRITDHGFMQRLKQAGVSLALHGHIHKAEAGQFRYPLEPGGQAVYLIGAGTFGAPVREWQQGYPLQYNLLRLQEHAVVVETRRRSELNGAWLPDAIWLQGRGKDPLPRYEVPLSPLPPSVPPEPDPPSLDPEPPPVFPKAYGEWLAEHCRHMDIDRLREKGRNIQAKLPELYIPLYTQPPAGKREKGDDPAGLLREKDAPIDIEELVRTAPTLLVRGQPGSGKTTLLRHYCFQMIGPEKGDAGEEILPVLIFMRDLRGLDPAEFPVPGAAAAERILTWLFGQMGNGLDLETVTRYCRAGRTVFLVDGLDEIDRVRRDLIVRSLADFRLRNNGCRMVFTGRPHGFEGEVIDRFGERVAEVLRLNPEQVGLFVRKWFCSVMESDSASCRRTADDLIDGMRTKPGIEAMKDSPLMLSAICLLYLDGKELPGQRAELYLKFIDYLVYRRFSEPEKVRVYLRSLALTMQRDEKLRDGIDRLPAIALLEDIFSRGDKESDRDYRMRLEGEFERIEPQCGLLKCEHGKYRFWHLSFQEFLAAVAIADQERLDFYKAIEPYWEDERFKEVVELYVGYLSIQNGGMANGIVQRVLEAEDGGEFLRWRLAAKSLRNIHQDRRDKEVVRLASDRLIMVVGSDALVANRVDAGETLGWLGDPRKVLRDFVPVAAGECVIEGNKVVVEGFEIGLCPVSNQWFEEFVETGGYGEERFWSEEGRKWLDYTGYREPRFWHTRPWNCPNAPVVGVSWYEADAFVKWLGESRNDGHEYFLPDEGQWQLAASGGGKGHEFPWQGQWQEGRCNTRESGLERTTPVGVFPKGHTPSGVVDMAGNVWEWTADEFGSRQRVPDFAFDPELHDFWLAWEKAGRGKEREVISEKIQALYEKQENKFPVLRGGSWDSDRDYARCAARTRSDPDDGDFDIGFRCARASA